MLLTMAQIQSIKAYSLNDGVDVERMPYDEYVLVRRYGAAHAVRIYRDGTINYMEADKITRDKDGNPLAWPDPEQPSWYIDAWNGSYSSVSEVLADLDSWVAKENERVLAYGERLIDETEAERRRMGHITAEEIADAFRPGG